MNPSTVVMVLLTAASAPASEAPRPRDLWRFKLDDFVIGAWWGPDATDAELALYRAAGFNVVMSGRYMQLETYADVERCRAELDLAGRHGLGVMIDTYTKNDRPWGNQPGPFDEHPLHHPANLAELTWLHERVGRHPALVGYMIGDDQGSISPRSAACGEFLRQNAPHLMPWLCGWISPAHLAAHQNPIVNPQIYPTLYNWELPADELAQRYAAAFAAFSRPCRDLGLLFWPMINVAGVPGGPTWCASDSLVRFPAYAAVAYGAEGLWYFTYNSGALATLGPHATPAAARAALTPLYPVAAECNRRLAAWGPRVLGRRCEGLFGTAFGARGGAWPFPEDQRISPELLAAPARGKLIESMSEELLVGLLTKPGEAPLAMIVDTRAGKGWADRPARRAQLTFSPRVTAIHVLEGAGRTVSGSSLGLLLEAGEGQLVELRGDALDALCRQEAIEAGPEAVPQRLLTPAELRGAQAAKLRLELFGSNGPPYEDKFIDLNGHRLGRVPGGGGDSWRPAVIDLTPEQLGWLAMDNELVVTTACADAWKFRGAVLAVRRADGTWARSTRDGTVWSSPGWAYTEGRSWAADGRAGPLTLRFE